MPAATHRLPADPPRPAGRVSCWSPSTPVRTCVRILSEGTATDTPDAGTGGQQLRPEGAQPVSALAVAVGDWAVLGAECVVGGLPCGVARAGWVRDSVGVLRPRRSGDRWALGSGRGGGPCCGTVRCQWCPPHPVLHGYQASCVSDDLRDTTTDWPCRGGFSAIAHAQGFDYLQQRLASHGFLTAHLGAVLLVGHTRGGEGVDRAVADGVGGSDVTIGGEVLIGPTG